uniref:Gustatory receptor n=1 Tax=Panagrellus redivivus TaxID=6233 RepID=A0A7E4V7N4_PANRE
MYPFNRSRDFRAAVRSRSHESNDPEEASVFQNENMYAFDAANVMPDENASFDAHVRKNHTEANVFFHPETNVASPTPISTQEQSFMANIMRFSMPNNHWKARFNSTVHENESFIVLAHKGHTVVRGIHPVLCILRTTGFLPSFVNAYQRQPWRRRIFKSMLFLMSICIIGFNAHIYSNNLLVSNLYRRHFGLMHAATVSHMISGIKPLVNAMLVIIFLWRTPKQIKMLRMMDTVDLCFRSTFHKSPPTTLYSAVFCFAFGMALAIPLGWRLYEVSKLYDVKTEILSMIIVPLLTVWNVLPLIYYVLCNRIVRFWCRVLRKSLRKEHTKRHFSLKFYYEQFLRITALQEKIGNTFNPFILFSLAWSLILLCLTIYFITQPQSSLTEPISHEQQANNTIRNALNQRIQLNMGWSVIQILVAVLNICVISATGMTTNEETRKILSAVLAIVPDANADLDRFQVSSFVHKMSTQYMWGMTLVSVIISYSLLLLKLKDNPYISPKAPNVTKREG